MLAVQVAPQLMPAGDEVTVPLPAPALVTVSCAVGTGLNVAVTVVLAVRLTTHVPVPLHPPPDHPAKAEPAAAAAVSVTFEPVLNEAVHVVPQLMPAGCDVTFPLPEPLREMLSCAIVGGGELLMPAE